MAASGTFNIQVLNPLRWLFAVWVPTADSVGQIIGTWVGRATAA